jgi:sigma-B regulation protein RsbU (phosphoserine phosphatase)
MLKDDHADLLTASVMVLHLATGRLRYASAGHPPALLTDGNEVRHLVEGGPLVGAFAASWATADAVVPPGWTLLVHSDGITDTFGADRERFGDGRLQDCMTTSEPIELLANIERAIDGFRIGPRSDDATAIAVHRIDVPASPNVAPSSTPTSTSAATTAPGGDTISA